MDTPITTRIAHLNGAHYGEEETAASLGCGACYRAVAEGESAPRGRFDADPPARTRPDLDNPNVARHVHDYPYGHGTAACPFGYTTLQHRLAVGQLRQRREQPARRAYARWTQRANLKDFTAFVPGEVN